MDGDAQSIPRGWAVARLGDVIPKARPKIPADPKSLLPFIGMDHIEANSFHLTGQESFARMKSAGSYFRPGDVLYGRLRPYLNKVYRAKFEGVASAEFIVMPASDFYDGDFFKYLLHQRKFVDYAMSRSSGDRPRVKFDGITEFEFPLPPLNEQRRIVEKIEILFTQLDKGEEALRDVQKLLARYRQSVLKAAVTGQLTAEWRAENAYSLGHGRDLLDRILVTRRKTWVGRGNYKEPSAPDISDLPELPEGWVWTTLENLGFVKSGQTPKGVEELLDPAGTIPWFKVSSMNEPGNETELKTSQWRFSENGAKNAGLNLLPPGTIVFPKRGGAILTNKKRRLGKCAALDLNTMGFVPVAIDNYLWTFFQGLDLRNIYDGSNVPQINYHDIADVPIALPSSEDEAMAIADIASSSIEQIVRLESWCQTELARSSALRQSILKDAFAGRLVPQDPADEPAAVLLARIKETRATAPGRTRRKVRA